MKLPKAVKNLTVFKTRTFIASALFISWGVNLWYANITSLSFEWILKVASSDVWAAIFVVVGIVMGIGAYRSNGLKGRLANRACAVGTAIATVWSLGFFIGWVETGGGTGAGLSGFILWMFILLNMFVTARSSTVDPLDEWTRPDHLEE